MRELQGIADGSKVPFHKVSFSHKGVTVFDNDLMSLANAAAH